MAKTSRGVTHLAAGKKKAKKRPLSQAINRVAPSTSAAQSAEPEQRETGASSSRTMLQFRPRTRESAAARPIGGRVAASARSALQAMDYSYVYTDLRIIGVLSVCLVGGLVGLSFVVR